jgi:hypothetical protein
LLFFKKTSTCGLSAAGHIDVNESKSFPRRLEWVGPDNQDFLFPQLATSVPSFIFWRIILHFICLIC